MTAQFNDSAKHISDELIAMSMLLDTQMETWADVFARRPASEDAEPCAGFVSSLDAPNGTQVVIDVQLSPDASSGIVRTKAIETIHDEKGNERFNNISLQYAVDRASAQQLVEKAGSITREDIKQLLHADTSQLESAAISDETGRDNKSQQLLGKRYGLDADELAALSETTEEELIQAAHVVLAKLQQTAANEAQ